MTIEALTQKFVVQNIAVWTSDEVLENQDVVVEDGLISDILPTGQNFHDHLIFAPTDALIHPLGVDPQAHLRVPGQKQKETSQTGITAALRGGYGALLTMPNTLPVIDRPEICDQAMAEIRPWQTKLGVQVYLSAAMTLGQRGEEVVDGDALKNWGVKALTDDGKGLASDKLMNELFEISERTGLPLLQHAEFPGHGGVLAPGSTQKKLGVKPYFADPEVEMVRRDLSLLRQHPRARYHVLHVSSAQTIELVAQAKKEGLPVTCEVCPHHLLFTAEDIPENDSSFKMNPPLRSANDRLVLRQALDEGVIDFVSTDHAPHEAAVKTREFTSAAFGTTGLETALRALLYLNAEGFLSSRRVVETFSLAPAQFLGIENEIAFLARGQKFECAVVENKSQSFKVSNADLASLSHNSCFLGFPMPGKITRVYNRAGVFSFRTPLD